MEYVTILMVFGIALLVGGAMIGLPTLLAPRRATAVKAEPFECGKDLLALPEGRFAIKFSTVAIFFIIFDIEVMLIFPWAVQVRPLGWPGRCSCSSASSCWGSSICGRREASNGTRRVLHGKAR
ncbi:MAG: NADH-quinone oxidoreductase subunit A [Candidatus Rokubacteria bacterium]|nr:NADH-quinone oxidoreductase subunit A [Candidatus Rokubacteria bacterium]